MTESVDERKTKLRQAYGQATTALRAAHRTEFDALMAQHAEALGVTWSPRLTAEQKAEQEFDQLILDFPHLRERFTQG